MERITITIDDDLFLEVGLEYVARTASTTQHLPNKGLKCPFSEAVRLSFLSDYTRYHARRAKDRPTTPTSNY
jgi:hypothetical protein